MPLTGEQKKEYMKEYEKKRRLGWGKILIQFLGGTCAWCGASVNLELDHKIPLHAGGKDSYENIQVLCAACHKKKTTRERSGLTEAYITGRSRRTIDQTGLGLGGPPSKKGLDNTRVFCEHCRAYISFREWGKGEHKPKITVPEPED